MSASATQAVKRRMSNVNVHPIPRPTPLNRDPSSGPTTHSFSHLLVPVALGSKFTRGEVQFCRSTRKAGISCSVRVVRAPAPSPNRMYREPAHFSKFSWQEQPDLESSHDNHLTPPHNPSSSDQVIIGE